MNKKILLIVGGIFIICIGVISFLVLINNNNSNNNSKSIMEILPTADDFNSDWNITAEGIINENNLTDKQKEINREYKLEEQYFRVFTARSDTNWYDSSMVSINISKFQTPKIIELFNDNKENIEKGYIETTVKLDIDTEDVNTRIDYKNIEYPNIGEESIAGELIKKLFINDDPHAGVRSITIDNIYFIDFVKKDFIVSFYCYNSDYNKSRENCIYWAKFIEKKI